MYTILYSHVFYLFDSEHLLPLATEATEHPSQVSASYSVLTTVPRTTFCISHSATHVALIYTNDSNKQTTISLRCQEFYEGHLPRIHRLHDLLLPSKISLSLFFAFSPCLCRFTSLHNTKRACSCRFGPPSLQLLLRKLLHGSAAELLQSVSLGRVSQRVPGVRPFEAKL